MCITTMQTEKLLTKQMVKKINVSARTEKNTQINAIKLHTNAS